MWTNQMLDDTGYGPSFKRRGSGNMLTHTVMAAERVRAEPSMTQHAMTLTMRMT